MHWIKPANVTNLYVLYPPLIAIGAPQVKCPVPSRCRIPRRNLPWTVSSGLFTTSWLWRKATCPSPYARWGSLIPTRRWIKSGQSSPDAYSASTSPRYGGAFLYPCRDFTNVPAYPAAAAALNIIITGATRQPELFYPWFIHIVTLSKDWFPFITDYVIQNSYSYTPWTENWILHLLWSTGGEKTPKTLYKLHLWRWPIPSDKACYKCKHFFLNVSNQQCHCWYLLAF